LIVGERLKLVVFKGFFDVNVFLLCKLSKRLLKFMSVDFL